MNPLKKQDKFEERLKEKLSELEVKPSNTLWDRIEKNLDSDGFEPSIQNMLESYTLEPNANVWTDIESQLPETRKRYGMLWISLITFILGVGFGTTYWFKPNAPESIENKIVLSEPIAAKSVENLISEKTLVEKKKYLASKSQFNKKASHKRAVAEPKNLSGMPTLNKEARSANVRNKTPKTFSIFRKKELVISSAEINGKLVSSATISENTVSDIPNVHHPENKDQAVLKPAIKLATPILNVDSKESVLIKSLDQSLSDSSMIDQKVRAKDYGPSPDELGKVSITATVGIQMCYLKLNMPSHSSYSLQQSYALRQEMETPAMDYNGGFLINYHINQKFFVSAGIQISNFKQSINFSLIAPIDTNTILLRSKNLYLHPNDSLIQGNANVLENKYSFTEIPLYLNFNVYHGEALDFDLQAGVSYAMLNLVAAYMPDPGLVGLLQINGKDDFPKLKNTFFASFSPSISYKINNALAIGAIPSVKVAISSIINNPEWIQEHPWFIGMNLFIRKRF